MSNCRVLWLRERDRARSYSQFYQDRAYPERNTTGSHENRSVLEKAGKALLRLNNIQDYTGASLPMAGKRGPSPAELIAEGEGDHNR